MKKTVILMAMLCLFALGVCAQSKSDFSGTWTLDKSKSKLSENARIESMTITATQTATDIKVETMTKRMPPPEGGMGGQGGGQGGGGGRMGGGMGGGMGGMGGGTGIMTYTLDGKEVTTEVDGGQMGKIPVKMKAEVAGDGKLKLMSSRTFNGPNGEITTKTTETWELADGGKTLKVKRDMESPRGTQTTEMVFTKG